VSINAHGSTFSNNYILPDEDGSWSSWGTSVAGGAIFTNNFDMITSDFKNNYAVAGGAIYLSAEYNSTNSLDGVSFENNTATGIGLEEGGGALLGINNAYYFDAVVYLYLTSCSFDNNQALYGADLYVFGIDYQIEDSGSPDVYEEESIFAVGEELIFLFFLFFLILPCIACCCVCVCCCAVCGAVAFAIVKSSTPTNTSANIENDHHIPDEDL